MGPQFVSLVEGMIEDFDASRETVGEGVNVNNLIGEWLARIPRIDPAWQRDGAVATVRLALSAARSRPTAARSFAKAAVSKMAADHLYEGALCRWVDHDHELIVFGIVPRPGGEPGVRGLMKLVRDAPIKEPRCEVLSAREWKVWPTEKPAIKEAKVRDSIHGGGSDGVNGTLQEAKVLALKLLSGASP